MKTLLSILIIIFCSCSTLRTGYYTVEAVRGRTVNLKGISNDLYFPTDTLKKGDRVFVKRVRKQDKANVW